MNILKPYICISLITLSLAPLCNAQVTAETKLVKKQNVTNEIPSEIKQHITAMFTANEKQMLNSYADTVRIMPGHECLKPMHGLEQAKAGGRNVAIDLPAKTIIDFNISQGKNLPGLEVLQPIINSLAYVNLPVTTGDFSIAPGDPVGTPDGKLHFQIVKGDKLIKITPATHEDFILFQLRRHQTADGTLGKWKIVAEYVD